MNITLKRNEYIKDGIFGELLDENNYSFCVTLEHAYQQDDATYAPKLSPGTYDCVRGLHQLEHMTTPFETFEITNVPGHTNILFHVGNYNNDSEGCVLLGTKTGVSVINPPVQMILNSKVAFNNFVTLQQSINNFTLTVLGE
jgi:hypothetical protein